jgi:hypothetical protein
MHLTAIRTSLFFLIALLIFCEITGQNIKIKDKEGDKEKIMTAMKPTDKPDSFLLHLFSQYPHWFDTVVKNKDAWKVQVIYSQIDRDKNNMPSFSDHGFNLDPGLYFYPASTVKLPIAALALQKLNELNIAGLDRNSTMITGAADKGQTEVYNDPGSPDGRPSIAQYIKKVLLVSDNDAFNRLYEFLGQEYINNSLHKLGLKQAQILHRLQVSLTEAQNRNTNPVSFFDNKGRLIYKKPAETSNLVYEKRNTKIGIGYIDGHDSLVYEAFDFSTKNRLTLSELHQVVRMILFPGSMPKEKQFDLRPDDYDFLRKYMSMVPAESGIPQYDSANYPDHYVKFLYYGTGRSARDTNIRIFNKTGDAYGFMIDAAYFADFKQKIEFQLSAIIYCNSDGILNDDKYDYDTVGLPFMKHLGEAVYQYELGRKRRFNPDLSEINYDYWKK